LIINEDILEELEEEPAERKLAQYKQKWSCEQDGRSKICCFPGD
jgi:hypothetical protein